MAWLSRNNFTPSDYIHSDDLNNLANDQRTWGGDVNGGGHVLANVIFSGASGFQYYLSPVQVSPTTAGGSAVTQWTALVGSARIARWSAGADGTAETGSNAGSNYAITRYSDAGAVLGTPMTINRANGMITFASYVGIAIAPTAPLHVNNLGAAVGGSNNILAVARFADGGVNSNMGVTFETGLSLVRGFMISKSSQNFRIVRYDLTNAAPPLIDFAVNSSGFCGVGTNNTYVPVSHLHVYGASGTGAPATGGGTLYMNDTGWGAGSGGAIVFGAGGSGNYWAGIKAYWQDGTGNTAGDLVFYTRTLASAGSLSESMRIAAGGNVGINMAVPAAPIHINNLTGILSSLNNCRAVARFADGGAGSNMGLTFETGATGTTAFRGFFVAKNSQDFTIARFDSAGTAGITTDMIIKSNGSVGVNTATPTSKLQVVGLPTYASDSAAGSGGLTSGAFYADAAGGLHVKL